MRTMRWNPLTTITDEYPPTSRHIAIPRRFTSMAYGLEAKQFMEQPPRGRIESNGKLDPRFVRELKAQGWDVQENPAT